MLGRFRDWCVCFLGSTRLFRGIVCIFLMSAAFSARGHWLHTSRDGSDRPLYSFCAKDAVTIGVVVAALVQVENLAGVWSGLA